MALLVVDMTNEDPDTARDVEKADELIAAAEESQLKRERNLLREHVKDWRGIAANLQEKLNAAEQQIKLACEDSARDDTAIRNLCRPLLTEQTCDHDGYAVVPVVDAVKNALEVLEKQCAAMRHSMSDLLLQISEWRGTPENELIRLDGKVGNSPLQKTINRVKYAREVLATTAAGLDYKSPQEVASEIADLSKWCTHLETQLTAHTEALKVAKEALELIAGGLSTIKQEDSHIFASRAISTINDLLK